MATARSSLAVLLAAAAAFGLPTAAFGQEQPAPGVYTGSYQCAQGTTPATLEIRSDGAGMFTFGGGRLPRGSYAVRVVPRPGGEVELAPQAWVQRPAGYVAVAFRVRPLGSRLEGRVLGPGCSTISLAGARAPAIVQSDRQAQPSARPQPVQASAFATPKDLMAFAERGPPNQATDEKVAALRRLVAEFPSDPMVPKAHWWMAFLYRSAGRHAEAAAAAFEGYRAGPQDGFGRNALKELARNLNALKQTEALCRVVYEFRDVYPDETPIAYESCNAYQRGPAFEGARPLGVTATFDPRSFQFTRSRGPVLPVSLARVRTLSDAQLAALPKPSQSRPVYYDFGDGVGRLVYSFRDCDGRQLNAYLGYRSPTPQDPTRYVGVANGTLCGDKPYQFPTVRVSFDEARALLAKGQLEDGYGGKIAPTELARALIGSEADFQQIRRLLNTTADSVGPAGSPGPRDIARVFAASLIQGHPSSRGLQKLGILSGPEPRSGGYGVVYDIEGNQRWAQAIRPAALALWKETYVFFVDEDTPPRCKAVPGGAFDCAFRWDVKVEAANLGKSLMEALTGGGESALEREQRLRAEAARKNFKWTPLTATFRRSGETWQSPQVAALTKEMAVKLEATRAEAARAMRASGPTAGDECRSEAMQDLAKGDTDIAAVRSLFCGM